MKMKQNRQRGMALLMAMILAVVAIILISAVSSRVINQRRQVDHFTAYKECFQGVSAAYNQGVADLGRGNAGNIGVSQAIVQPGQPFTWPDFDDQNVTPQTLTGMPNVEYYVFSQDWFTDGIDNNGDGITDDVTERWTYTVYAAAQNNDKVRRTESVVTGSNVNVWENAIFAGNGQAGGLINGNVNIHGSVHLLGEAVAAGNMSIEAIDLSGSSLIHNNYIGVPGDLTARVPPIPIETYNGEAVESLRAKLRVKNGLVGMSGNSEIGEPDVVGNSIKELMNGTYVSDGWSGNDVTMDATGRGIPNSVYSENGWDELYDLGNKVPFPLLTDDWRDPVTGLRVNNPATGNDYTHEEFFSEVLLADPLDAADGVHVGDITIEADGSDYYWNATTGVESATLPAVQPAADDDYIIFDAAANTLLMNGQITIDGNLVMTGKANDMTINYSGRAAFLVNGDVTLDCNLLSCHNGDPNNSVLSFPEANIIGIMARDDMLVGGLAQLSLMGAFYAQGTITSKKQTNVMGTFVAGYFDMGSQVPSIFQVPELPNWLPYGMIGDYPIMIMQPVAWREIGVNL